MIRNRWSFICQEPRFESSVLKIICSILMLMIKKHLKSQYQVTSMEIARASLMVDEQGINRRDVTVNAGEVKEMNVATALKKIPSSEREMIALVKLFQAFAFDDPVENVDEKEAVGRRKSR